MVMYGFIFESRKLLFGAVGGCGGPQYPLKCARMMCHFDGSIESLVQLNTMRLFHALSIV